MLREMKHIDLFSGIGGFALAVDRAFGLSEHVFVERDQFCQAILRKHWEGSTIYGDIRKFIADADSQRGNAQKHENKEREEIDEGWTKKPLNRIDGHNRDASDAERERRAGEPWETERQCGLCDRELRVIYRVLTIIAREGSLFLQQVVCVVQ